MINSWLSQNGTKAKAELNTIERIRVSFFRGSFVLVASEWWCKRSAAKVAKNVNRAEESV